jgi:hypothetical protein
MVLFARRGLSELGVMAIEMPNLRFADMAKWKSRGIDTHYLRPVHLLLTASDVSYLFPARHHCWHRLHPGIACACAVSQRRRIPCARVDIACTEDHGDYRHLSQYQHQK